MRLLVFSTIGAMLIAGCLPADGPEAEAKRKQMTADCSKLAAAHVMRPGGTGVSDGGAEALKIAQDCMKANGY